MSKLLWQYHVSSDVRTYIVYDTFSLIYYHFQKKFHSDILNKALFRILTSQ